MYPDSAVVAPPDTALAVKIRVWYELDQVIGGH
jgi:hypothetical protein